jgi:hypothetical protein
MPSADPLLDMWLVVVSCAQPRPSLVENLFLRKQLALYLQRKIEPRTVSKGRETRAAKLLRHQCRRWRVSAVSNDSLWFMPEADPSGAGFTRFMRIRQMASSNAPVRVSVLSPRRIPFWFYPPQPVIARPACMICAILSAFGINCSGLGICARKESCIPLLQM